MIAYEAVITNPQTVKADGEEIEEIVWLTREELKQKSSTGELLMPPLISVARAMINNWYGPTATQDLSGGEAWRS
jgi:NAD+ diphosphatase